MVLYVVKEKNVLVTAKELWEESYWNKCRPLTLPNFVMLRQEMCRISSYPPRKVVLLEKGTKVDQNPLGAAHQCPLSCRISSRSVKLCTRKALQIIFLHPSIFCRPRGTPGPKFTDLGPDIQQVPLYQSAKFRPVLTTHLQDTCCQILSISVTAWLTKSPTKKTVNDVSAYHAATIS